MTTLPSPNPIAVLNDQLRRHAFTNPAAVNGTFRVMLTQGCQAIDASAFAELIGKIEGFDAFTAGNDPWGEHDFGAVEVHGTRFFFKIDYYDPSLQAASPDPADAAVTVRVLTIMRADEY